MPLRHLHHVSAPTNIGGVGRIGAHVVPGHPDDAFPGVGVGVDRGAVDDHVTDLEVAAEAERAEDVAAAGREGEGRVHGGSGANLRG